MPNNKNSQRGFVETVALLGIALMLLTLPLAQKLATEKQSKDIRNYAAESASKCTEHPGCNTTDPGTCYSWAGSGCDWQGPLQSPQGSCYCKWDRESASQQQAQQQVQQQAGSSQATCDNANSSWCKDGKRYYCNENKSLTPISQKWQEGNYCYVCGATTKEPVALSQCSANITNQCGGKNNRDEWCEGSIMVQCVRDPSGYLVKNITSTPCSGTQTTTTSEKPAAPAQNTATENCNIVYCSAIYPEEKITNLNGPLRQKNISGSSPKYYKESNDTCSNPLDDSSVKSFCGYEEAGQKPVPAQGEGQKPASAVQTYTCKSFSCKDPEPDGTYKPYYYKYYTKDGSHQGPYTDCTFTERFDLSKQCPEFAPANPAPAEVTKYGCRQSSDNNYYVIKFINDEAESFSPPCKYGCTDGNRECNPAPTVQTLPAEAGKNPCYSQPDDLTVTLDGKTVCCSSGAVVTCPAPATTNRCNRSTTGLYSYDENGTRVCCNTTLEISCAQYDSEIAARNTTKSTPVISEPTPTVIAVTPTQRTNPRLEAEGVAQPPTPNVQAKPATPAKPATTTGTQTKNPNCGTLSKFLGVGAVVTVGGLALSATGVGSVVGIPIAAGGVTFTSLLTLFGVAMCR